MQRPGPSRGEGQAVVVDPQGNALALWSDLSTLSWARIDRHAGWGAPAQINVTSDDVPAWLDDKVFFPDLDGNASIILQSPLLPPRSDTPLTFYFHHYSSPQGWSDIPSLDPDPKASDLIVLAGPGGRAAEVKVVSDDPSNPLATQRLMVRRYGPGAGAAWTAGDMLDQETPTTASDSVEFLGMRAAVASDGSVLVVWTRRTKGDGSVLGDNTTMFARFVPGAGWSAAQVTPNLPDQLLPDGDGNVWAVFLGGSNPTETLTIQPVGANGWGQGKTLQIGNIDKLSPGSGSYSISVGRHGAIAVTWTNYGLNTAYFSPGSDWKQIQLPGDNSGRQNRFIAVDARGRVVITWQESHADSRQVDNTHVFYARYDPQSGWSAPGRVDDDEGGSDGEALGINDAGDALLLWERVDDLGTDKPQSTFWATYLP